MSVIRMARVGELSRQTGITVETLRYYERIGLLPTDMPCPMIEALEERSQ